MSLEEEGTVTDVIAEENKDETPTHESPPKHEPLDHELLREDLIHNQITEKENAFYNALLAGFQSLKEARETRKTPLFASDDVDAQQQSQNAGSHKIVPMHVTVNFIDPTTRPGSTASTKVENLLSKSRLASPPSELPPVDNVFERLSFIFERDYGATLRGVQYKNPRSGEADVISSIPVQMILTRTGNASGTGEAANVAWGGMAASAATPSIDPAEWHNAPFCHVYIAACQNMEHYRSKVRPSLQAFVSQIEAAFGPPAVSPAAKLIGSAAAATLSQTESLGNYLIVYIPTGGSGAKKSAPTSGSSEEATTGSGPVRRTLASQFAKARERIANYQQDMDNNSIHSKDSLGSADHDGVDDDPDAAATSLSLQVLSPQEKVLFKKLVKDFSSGKVCVLSKTSLEKFDDDQGNTIMTADSAVMALRTQEWNSFNRMLGVVIVNGFKDRCRRYNEELRRLDAQRAAAAQAEKNPHKTPPTNSSNGTMFFGVGGNNKTAPVPPAVFNLGYFFLVKESLAFTYEQMQLPGEAMLQYDEFRAFLPDLNDEEYKRSLKLRRKSKALKGDNVPPLADLADTADFVGFRKRLRAEFDLTPILEIIRRYLFAREIRLLFKMEQPVEVISRCEAFCKHMYSVMMRCVLEMTNDERKQRELDAAKWVVQFIWDVKSSCDVYLRSNALEASSRESFDSASVDTHATDLTNNSGYSSQSDQNIASRLGELLEMARLLFKELGDMVLESENPLRKYEQALPADMFQKWEPWNAPDTSADEGTSATPKFGSRASTTERQFLLDNAFTSIDKYENTYLDILGAIVNLSNYGHRKRLAFRLQGEIAEYWVRKGDLKAAAAVFKLIVKQYRWDQWDRLHFWRLFRLSFCQRSTAAPTDYLKTLATCFSPRTAAVAPKKALQALQQDLEQVIEHPSIGESKYGTIAFLETSIDIPNVSFEESTIGSGSDRKRILKRFYAVGETVTIKMILQSHLPREIILDSLKLFIVESTAFMSIVENRESVEEEDSFKTLVLEGGVRLLPGANSFSFEWTPATAGQFILSTIEVVWKQGFFYYDTVELSLPLLGVNVIPSKPTQSLVLNPPYLVPGHDQEVRITFDAGSDLVTAGMIHLACSEGITMIGPGESIAEGQWKKGSEVALGPCKPREQTVLNVHVRCALIDTFSRDSISQVPSFDTSHGLRVKVFTKYLHAGADGTEDLVAQEMKSMLEEFAPILEKTALSVESVDHTWLIKSERLLINVNLLSNTPDHFSILDLSILLPPPLLLVKGVDLNSDLCHCSVSDGDQIALTFECTVRTAQASSSVDDAMLQVKLCDDNKKEFSLELPLDLDDLYLQVLETPSQPKAIDEAKACLKLAANEGIMGEPIKFTYTVETQAEGEIVFSIDPEGTNWLIAGKVNGSMERSGFMSLGFMGSCEVWGIPVTPGVLTSFPKMEIGIVTMKGGYTPLKMKLTLPDSFRSLARQSAVAVAYPTNKIAV